MKKHAIVTGGTKGIGKEICRQLLQKNYVVLFSGRDSKAAEANLAEFTTTIPEAQAEFIQGDLGSIASTKALAKKLGGRFPQIDILINNAGIWPTKVKLNPDGLEMAFMVNHMAPLILSHTLIPHLKSQAPARIVNVNAGLYIKGNLELDKTPYGKDFHKIKTYCNTKLCNTLISLEMAERLKHHDISLNAVHPGVIRTGLGEFGGIMGLLLKGIKKLWKSPPEGAKAPVWLAVSPELEGITGKYYDECKEMELSDKAKDIGLRKALWEKSLELADLSWEY